MTLGRYVLLEEIPGEAADWSIWRNSGEPVRRRVALKIPQAGMDTRSAVARFEASARHSP